MSLPPLNRGGSESGGLGSLAQSARSKNLNDVRRILVAIGILNIVANVIGLIFVRAQLGNAGQMDLMGEYWLIFGSGICLGALFVIFGLAIHTYPVPVTILSLVLYVGANAVYAARDPETLKFGWVVKIIIVVALVKAIGTAAAYQKEMTASREIPQDEYE